MIRNGEVHRVSYCLLYVGCCMKDFILVLVFYVDGDIKIGIYTLKIDVFNSEIYLALNKVYNSVSK